jgi:phosphoribosylformylglycinamidine synthase
MTVLGEFTGDGVLRIKHMGDTVGELDCGFLHGGIPRQQLQAVWAPPVVDGSEIGEVNPARALLDLLASANIRSKEETVRRYDHEVQGGTVVKPFVGADESGPGDAAVVTPLAAGPGTPGAALAIGTNPAYGPIDPYRMAWANIDEAVRNVVAVGADPDRISILDNFSWGNPRIADRLGSLVRCTQGCYDAAVAYGTPFISGKDSLNNEYTGIDGNKHTIPGTLVISSLGIVPDVTRTVTSAFKQPGNRIYIVGATGQHLGGSALAAWADHTGGRAPAPVPEAPAGYRALHRAITSGLVHSCHDVAEGGIAVAVAEMAIGGGIGASIDLATAPGAGALDGLTLTFSESLGRLLVEVGPDDAGEFERIMGDYPTAPIGETTAGDEIEMTASGFAFGVAISAARDAWRGGIV